jgi:acetyltransferase-like isoleucine patch superfamily enzyme
MSSAESRWSRGAALAGEHRARLVAAGAEPEALDRAGLSVVSAPLPPWWHEQGNALYLGAGVELAESVVSRLALYPFSGVLLAFGSTLPHLASLLVGGDEALVFVGPGTQLTAGDVYCGPRSSIVLNGDTVATRCAVLDARNGGAIVAAPDQLWAANVYIATDDMHRLEDLETGERINPYGATIRLGEHVWLGREAIVTGHAEVGEGAVVGSRSMVRGQKVPAHTAVAGTPARVIREGITWRGEDTP